MTKQTIGLVYDLRSEYLAEGYSEADVAEFDSDSTIDALHEAIASLGFTVDRIGHGRRLAERLVAGDSWDLVFSIAEGLRGRSREAQVPALLEMYGVPYVFSDPLTCAATLDKAVAKKIVAADGVRTPGWVVVRCLPDVRLVADRGLHYPLFVKPLAEGTGKGVDGRSRIHSLSELREACRRLLDEYHQPVLVESYLSGREFTTGILGTGEHARVLGTLEIIIREGAPEQDYSYLVKEECEKFVEYLPAGDESLVRAVESLALAAHRSLECRDASRVDIRVDAEGYPCFLEANPLPGLHPTHSDLPMIATSVGMSYASLLGEIIASAMRRASERV